MTDTHIKIKPVVPKVQYTGNGVTTDFPYTFAIFDETDMVVYLDYDIVESGYTITGAGETDGGNVVFDTAPDDGVKITLLRNVPIERLTDFQEGGTFRPKNINDEFDRQTAFCQQVQESLSRAVVVDPTSDVNPEQVLTQVERVYESIDNVDAVADDITNVNAVAGNSTNINAVASNATNINAVAGNAENINAVAGNATNINAVNSNKTNIDTCANNISAITGASTQAANAAASAAASAASAELSVQYANDKINQTHITKCITEIPQDIKLELNNGTLTLKAGSKVYVPNGAGVFDVITVPSDKAYVSGSGLATGPYYFFYNTNSNSLSQAVGVYSGSSEPTGKTYMTWYDTVNNLVKTTNDGGSTWTSGLSLPIGIVLNETGSKFSSIDQVFNGVGYIVNTFFAYPNVKGLVPNGRNADGTLKNLTLTTQNVYIRQNLSANTSGVLTIGASGFGFVNSYTYNEEENLQYSGTTSFTNGLGYARFTITDGKITSFIPKMPFHAVDYYDALKYNDICSTQATTSSTANKKSPALVVENYYNSSNGDWYRIWSDGWIEQGGKIEDITGEHTLTFLKPFKTTNYSILKSSLASNTNSTYTNWVYYKDFGFYNLTTTTADYHNRINDGLYPVCWYACGY